MRGSRVGTESKSFEQADEVRTPAKTTIDVLNFGEHEVARYTFEPGWKWSECIKPVVGTDRCEKDHIGYVFSGSLIVEDADGSTREISAGDSYRIPPGHDAWVSGDEPMVSLEWNSPGYATAK
jgi:mannose-6-phosphate isomerase-like protein (cupin superfamily)